MTCPRCQAPAADGTKFCTTCGSPLDGVAPAIATTRTAADPPPPRPQARSAAASPPLELVACPTCGASNAASRVRCGRCQAELAGGRAPLVGRGDVFGADGDHDQLVDREPRVLRLLVVVTLLAAVAVAAVVIALLGARGMGWFAPSQAVAPVPGGTRLEIVDVTSSSELAGQTRTFGPADNLVDDDPETAWVEGVAGLGIGEWVELQLAEPALLRRLVVWNGYQRGELFAVSNRVTDIRIDIGERTFRGELLDTSGPQAIDLPEPVRGDRVRLTVEGVHRGERGTDTAISEIQLHGDVVADDD